MEKDWSTINVQRDQAFGGESDEMRQRLLHHHEAITALAQSAPTEELTRRYSEVRAEIEQAIQRLDDLRKSGAASSAAYASPAANGTAARPGSWTNTQPYTPPAPQSAGAAITPEKNRTIILVLLGVVALSVFALLGWRYLRGHDSGKVVAQPASRAADSTDSRIVEAPAPNPAAVAAAAEGLVITPASQAFGKVKKGTRIVKKFQIANNSSETLNIAAGRSQCHCLWFQFNSRIAAGAKVPMTITLDGARAKKGPVNETITLKSKEHPEETSTVGVTANVE